MPEPLFSSSWYRVAELRPSLRRHARISRHVYRGRPWYVLEDVVNQRVHRFTPATHSVVGMMDGQRRVQDIWESASETLGDEAPTQDEMIRLLAQLHAADVLQCDVPPDTAELLERFEKRESQELRSKLLSPFAVRLPIFDPDRFLRRVAPWLRVVMNPFGVFVWLAVVLPALVGVGVHWRELTEGIIDRVLAPQSLVLIWLLFPVIKGLHELGHGLIARYYGGEVHDMGVMLLVFTPIPYVDASSASAFPERRQRALVATGGMIVEVFLAALAFYVWLSAEPGAVRTLAYNAMLIGGVTTLTFNANPLLRFDGYYILSDLIEIPNLRQRSSAYLGYLFERYAIGSSEGEPPDTAGIEPFWLVTYGIAAFIYRVVIVWVIMLFVFDLSLVLGAILALVSAVGWIGIPVVKALRGLFFSPKLRRSRGRVVLATAGPLALLFLVIFAAPIPLYSRADGVVWVPEEANVRAATPCFIERFLAEPGSLVQAGQPLIECSDPDLPTLADVHRARLRSLRVRYKEARLDDLARAEVVAEEIRHLENRLQRIEQRLAALVLRAGRDGVFVVPRAEDLPGRFVSQGDLLAFVVELRSLHVRAVVAQEDIDLVRERLQGVSVRRAERVSDVLEARLLRLAPAARAELPSVALGSEGGGSVAVDPRDSRGTSAVQPQFEIELEMPNPGNSITVGNRVHLRFSLGPEPLASRWYRSLRQLFLSRFDV